MQLFVQRAAALFAIAIAIFAPRPVGASELNIDELDAWASGFFEERLQETHIPGAVLIIVKDGRPVLMRGFGVTTTEAGKAVDPEETLFRVGSVTKVMTAIATLQLIDEGVIDPEKDVNAYLKDVKVPEKFGAAVTVDDLLVHKGGFGSELRGAEAPTEAEAKLAPADIQRLLVPRVRKPGMYPAYDNNGWGLLGMVAADAAGVDYRTLMSERVFQPLGMEKACVGLPGDCLQRAARPHNINTDGDVWPIDYSILTKFEEGAGNISATGGDVARLMIALLQGEEIEGRRVLSPQAYSAMTDFGPNRIHPGMPGYGRPLYEFFPAGRYAIRHDGGISGFVSSMVLYPEENVGVFFSINAQPDNPFKGDNLSNLISGVMAYLKNGQDLQRQVEGFMKFYEFHEEFAEKYIPKTGTVDGLPGGARLADDALRRFEGTYRPTREQYGVFAGNLRARFLGGQKVKLLGDGVLQVGADKYVQNDKGVFEKEGGHEKLAFSENAHGVFMGPSSLFINKKVRSFETPLLTVAPLVLLPLFLLSGLFHLGSKTRLVRAAAALSGFAAIGFFVCMALEAEYASAFLVAGRTGMIFLWRIALTLFVAGVAAVAVSFFAAAALRLSSGGGRRHGGIENTPFAASGRRGRRVAVARFLLAIGGGLAWRVRLCAVFSSCCLFICSRLFRRAL